MIEVDVRDAIKEIMHRAKLTQKGLAFKAGYKSESSVTMPIANNNLTVGSMIRLADAAGYDLMLVRREAIEPEYPIKIDKAGRAEDGDGRKEGTAGSNKGI